MRRFTRALLALVSVAFSNQLMADDGLLTIGDTAPSLDVEHWVQNGEGRFKPVTQFEPGKVYVVEFWATWCGPCIGSMPHVVQTQAQYADQGLQFVSISDEPLDTVTKFLEREVPESLLAKLAPHEGQHAEDGDSGNHTADADEDVVGTERIATFKQLTSSYCLTTDPDRSVFESYMVAAGQNGIPTAFLVGKTGQIEWIGHPAAMDEPIARVVSDQWDREAFKEKFIAGQKMNEMVAELPRLVRRKKYEELKNLSNAILETAKPGTLAYARAMSGLEFSQFGMASLDEINRNLDELLNANPLNVDGVLKLTRMIISAKKAKDDRLDEAILEKSVEAIQTAIDSMGEGNDTEAVAKAAALQGYTVTLLSLGMKEKAQEAAQAAIKISPESEKANFEKTLARILKPVSRDEG